ncbi:MAG TPA: BON domain-containing protein [Kofleriaceae bacterium]|jgi:hypothetical protein
MAKTYDDITRKTVPNPDSSFRPSPEQIQQAKDGFRALDADEQALTERARSAIAPIASGITVEVTRDRITLSGTVKDAETLAKISDAVRDLGTIDDQLVIAP